MTFIGDTTQSETFFNDPNDTSIFEGDIHIDETDNLLPMTGSLNDIVTQVDRIWNTREGACIVIPYTIPQHLTDESKAQVARALYVFRRETCIK